MRRRITMLLALSMTLAGTCLKAEGDVAYPGRVEALNRVDVSARVDSVVSQIHFQPGQTVQEGDLLFTLDASDFTQQLNNAEAVAQKAEALHREAEQELQRNLQLKERGTITDVRLFKSQAALAISAAAMADAHSRLEAAGIALDRTRIRAPITGIISRPLISRGGYAETGRKGVLASIVQLDPIRIVYEIPYPDRLIELKITDLTTIETYSETIDLRVELAPGWIHPELAEPTFLSADVSPETSTISAWAIVANPTQVLRPGLAVKVYPLLTKGPASPQAGTE